MYNYCFVAVNTRNLVRTGSTQQQDLINLSGEKLRRNFIAAKMLNPKYLIEV